MSKQHPQITEKRAKIYLRKSADSFFPPRPDSRPTIYAYEDTNLQYAGLLKVGYTTVDVQSRVAQQYPTKRPGKPPYRLLPELAFDDIEVTRRCKDGGIDVHDTRNERTSVPLDDRPWHESATRFDPVPMISTSGFRAWRSSAKVNVFVIRSAAVSVVRAQRERYKAVSACGAGD